MKQSKWDPFRYEGLTAKQSFMGTALVFVAAGISG